MPRQCGICKRAIGDGEVSINGRHYRCHVDWCNEYDRTHMRDPEFAQEYYGDEA